MDTLTSLSWYFSNTLPAIFFTIVMHYSEMERCWGSRFFQHVLHSFNTDFFIAWKLLTNVNKQLNKAMGPSSLTAKCSQWGKGLGKKQVLELGSLLLQKALFKTGKKMCTTQRFYITKAQTPFTSLSSVPSFLLLRQALSRTRQFFVKLFFFFTFFCCVFNICKTQQFTTLSHEGFPAALWADRNSVSSWISHPCNEISGTRQH